MKKVLIISSIFLYIFLGVFVVNKSNYALPTNSKPEQYAKIIDSNCYFFKTPTKNYHHSNVMFILEKTYFVSIILEEKDFYYATYNNLKGYILKEQVELINEVPASPYLKNITFNISNPCFMYSSPESIEEAKIKDLPKNCTLEYIGKINGSTETLHGTNLWYYCKTTDNNIEIFGYVCSDNTNNLTPIQENFETTTISKISENNFLYLNSTLSNLIIVIISIPTILVVFLLLKAFKN